MTVDASGASHRTGSELKIWAVTFSIVLSLYLLTLAPDLTWAYASADGAELMTAAVTLGVPHPPGYPTYVLLGKLISWIPIGRLAWRFNLFSALCMAAASGMVSVIGFKRAAQLPPSLAFWPGILFGGSSLVWEQAIVTEVYALFALSLSITLYTWLCRQNRLADGFWFGLTLTTHLTALLIAPIWLLKRTGPTWPLFFGFCLGISPLCLLPLLARTGSPVVWGDPTTVEGWLWLVSGRLYRSNVLAADAQQWLEYGSRWIPGMGYQLGAIGWVWLAFGYRNRVGRMEHLFIHLTSFVFVIYAISYTQENRVVYLIPAVMLWAITLPAGMPRRWRWDIGIAVLVIAALIPTISLRNDSAVRHLGLTTLELVPAGSLLITDGRDETLFTLWALRYAEQHRTDITIVDQNLFAFEWYRNRLQTIDPTLNPISEDHLERFIELNGSTRPVCHVSLVPQSVTCRNYE